ncbi:MAG: hypothetical protein HC896_01730 [Bacteroidales bacterium]|nr:hypothetical protein [Bacteroidales bacterium]
MTRKLCSLPGRRMRVRGQATNIKINELITWIKDNKGTVTDLDQSKFHNFDVWVNKALEAKLDGQNTWVYSEVFDDGKVNLKSPGVDFVINEKYHSGFYLSYKYEGKTEEAIRIWTYSYPDFLRLLKELGYTLTESFKTKITDTYKDYLATYGDDCNKIDVVFENVPDFVISEISIDDRVKYLKSLVGCPMFNGGWIWGKEKDTDEELATFNLINTQDNQKTLIDKLLSEKVESEPVLKKLDNRLSDVEFVFPDKNYGKFAGVMWGYVENSYPVQDKISLYKKLHNDNKVFRWTHKLDGNYYSSSFGNDGVITISYSEVVSASYADYNGYLTLVEKTEKREFPVNAYDYVYLHFDVDLPALNVKKGDVCFVPVYVLHHLISDRINENTKDLVRVGIDVASIAIGVAEIKAGVKGARLFFEILEIGLAVGDIALTGFEDKLNETPEGAKFLKAFNTIAVVGGIANIGQAGITKLNSAMPDEIASLRNIWKNNPEVKSIVKAQNPTAANQIDNLVDELDEYEEWAKYAGDLGGSLTNFVAKSGDELAAYLNNLTTLPAGKTYKGNMCRSIGKQYNNPLEIHQGAIGTDYRYSRSGEGALYLSETKTGNLTEISTYGSISNYKTYEYANIEIDNMLDLTDDAVRKKLGVDFDLLTRTSSNLDEAYEFTHEIGTWAASKDIRV